MRPFWAILAVMVGLFPVQGGTAPVDDAQTLRRALTGTGIKLERYEGGPYVPAGSPEARAMAHRKVISVLPLSAPLARYSLSSGFGARRDPFRHRRAFHSGLDLRAPVRSPVMATAPGVVVFSGWRAGYGRMVEISHGSGVHTRYAHLARLGVRPGQFVGRGRTVGLLGSSGRSTGPHLHYEVLVDGVPRNPQRFLAAGRLLEVSAQR